MQPRLLQLPLPVLLAALLGAPSAAAQIAVAPVRDLAFGPVIVGVPSTVGPSHPTRSGQFQISAPLATRVQIRLTLPNQLAGPAGAQLPIGFSNNDAIVVGTASGSVPSTFNPKATHVFRTTSAITNVFIGGSVTPAASQPQGNYAATIILTVTNF
jgi:hypothetical protein